MSKVIMVQGTMSNAGKSWVAAGLCRVFAQDGYKVAPFKAQNMASLSHVTSDGKQMSVAQAVQAEAAGIEPHQDMNPILLKPTSHQGSQVIVDGGIWKTMSGAEYYKQKNKLLPRVMQAFARLQETYDIIVLEGAGSPAEINLKNEDLVNMGMAKRADAPVVLVGDIDCGGVFAQLVGTLQLLEEYEREIVKGLIINKFRGDFNILKPGLDMLEELAGKPILGVLPHVDLEIDPEDSLAYDSMINQRRGQDVDIAVIRLPSLSSYVRMEDFLHYENVSIRYVARPSELKTPDVIVVPATHNPLGDMQWLNKIGLNEQIKEQHRNGTCVYGMGGGYYLLGEQLISPFIQGEESKAEGLGLLPIQTTLYKEKKVLPITGAVRFKGDILKIQQSISFDGQDTVLGEVTYLDGAQPLLTLQDSASDHKKSYGCWRERALGSSLEGLFKNIKLFRKSIHQIKKEKDKAIMRSSSDATASKLKEYDKLAKTVREHLQMEQIYKILEQGV